MAETEASTAAAERTSETSGNTTAATAELTEGTTTATVTGSGSGSGSGAGSGEDPAEKAEQLIGTTISGRYRIESLLGAGGMGAVYLAQHTHMRKRFALKVLHKETLEVPELVARFEREAVASAHADHPNIAVATDFGRAESGAFFLVLEYLEGQRLRDVLATGALPVRRAVHIARQVASALSRSHELGIIHRDLKPENIMLVSRQGDRDFVKVLDFGLAKLATDTPLQTDEALSEAITRHGTVFGTPKYMAPEQCVGEAVDGRTDLYALGIILYEMLAGVHPFNGRGTLELIRQQISAPLPPMQDRAPSVSVPASLEAVVAKLCEKRPDERFASANDLLAALAEVCAREGILPPEPSASIPMTPSTAMPVPALPDNDSLGDGATHSVLPGDAAQSAPGAAPAEGTTAPLAPPAGVRTAVLPPAAKPPEAAVTRPALNTPTVGLFNREEPPAPRPVPSLGERLRSKQTLYAAAALAAGLGLFLWLRPAAPPTGRLGARGARPAVVTPAPQAQLDQAVQAGVSALLRLHEQYPSDPRVKRALAHAHMAQGSGVEALRWFAQVVALDSAAVPDGELLQAAGLAANPPEAADAAVALLEDELGARGVDVLYQLALRPGTGRLKTRATQSLSRPEVRAHATPAALIAIELRAATRCEAKHALLTRAAQVGDGRTLVQLKTMVPTRGCGTFNLSDCWPCLREDGALQAAISAITARSGGS